MAALRKLRLYPDPILHMVSVPVTDFDDNLYQLTEDMLVTMEAANGIGLSAVQVGILQRVITICGNQDSRIVLINPKIITMDGEQTIEEGCLSLPGVYETRKRANHVTAKYQILDGRETDEMEFVGLEAAALQHELDHLDGKVFIDNSSPLKKNRARTKIRKTIRKFQNDILKSKIYKVY